MSPVYITPLSRYAQLIGNTWWNRVTFDHGSPQAIAQAYLDIVKAVKPALSIIDFSMGLEMGLGETREQSITLLGEKLDNLHVPWKPARLKGSKSDGDEWIIKALRPLHGGTPNTIAGAQPVSDKRTLNEGSSWPCRRIRMREYEVVETNAENIGGCSLCGNKNTNNLGRRRKANWLKERYAEGLRYKLLRSDRFGDLGMIEYAPGDHAWRPVEAEGYLVIHCLMVNRRHTGKGLGMLLLDNCLRDARKSRCRGVAVVTSSDSFMAGSDLFIKAGFVSADRIPPYELLVKKLGQTAPDPRFTVDRERALKKHSKGLTILAADQCPYVSKSVERIAEASRKLGLEARVVRVQSAKASRELPTPYGVFSILYDGKLIAERPVSATRFTNIMLKRGTQRGMPIGVRSAQGDSQA